MPWWFWLILGLAVYVGFAAACWAIARNPRGDLGFGILYRIGRAYVFRFHGLRVEGREHLRRAAEMVGKIPSGNRGEGPLVIVANHTAGVDPLLISAVVPYDVRWIMAEDMRLPALEWFWKYNRVIFVSRGGKREGTGIRDAVRHLEQGGVIGIFPEGGIERPPRMILPFLRGLSLIISKTDAVVLPVVIDGTPQVDPAWASLWRPSRSRLRFLEPVRFSELGVRSGEIMPELRRRFLEATGWPPNDEVGDHPEPAPFEAPTVVIEPGEGNAGGPRPRAGYARRKSG